MKVASYTIESDSCIIVDKDNSFIIDLIKYNNRYMFRNQKIYPSLEKYTNDHNNYSELYKEILNWFNGYEEMLKENPKLRNIQLEFKEAKIGQEDLIDNDEDIQREAQYINSATYEQIKDAPTKEILIKESSSGKIIVRDPSLTKTAIVNANYQCEIDANHKTFINASGVPYMEGYHLIPCTVDNSNFIWERFERNVDCLENIVSLCPNCHRAIHFGNAETKEKMLVKLYSKKKTQLEKVGIRISFSHLLNFYKIKY